MELSCYVQFGLSYLYICLRVDFIVSGVVCVLSKQRRETMIDTSMFADCIALTDDK
jgi:hypothetical protein